MGDEDENDMQDMSDYEISGVRIACLGSDDLVSVELHAGLGLVSAISGMVNRHAHEILLSPSSSWSFAPSPFISLFIVLNSTIT